MMPRGSDGVCLEPLGLTNGPEGGRGKCNMKRRTKHLADTEMLFSLSGKKALVTGASSGIGRAIALGLAAAGADVAVLARGSDLEATADEIRAMGRDARAIRFDVGDTGRIGEVVAGAVRELGRLDLLVIAAGTTFRAPSESFPEDKFDEIIRVNLKSAFLFCQHAARQMIKQGTGGKIINIASMQSFQGGITIPAYAASKGGLAVMTKTMANDWAKYNIQVNAIAPGYIHSRLTASLSKDRKRSRAIMERIPAGRWGVPDDLRGAAVFLASKASDYVTGHILCVDGGYQAR